MGQGGVGIVRELHGISVGIQNVPDFVLGAKMVRIPKAFDAQKGTVRILNQGVFASGRRVASRVDFSLLPGFNPGFL